MLNAATQTFIWDGESNQSTSFFAVSELKVLSSARNLLKCIPYEVGHVRSCETYSNFGYQIDVPLKTVADFYLNKISLFVYKHT